MINNFLNMHFKVGVTYRPVYNVQRVEREVWEKHQAKEIEVLIGKVIREEI